MINPNRQWALFAGPLLASAVAGGMSQFGWSEHACWTGAVAILCVIWWIFEPIPIPATSIIPLAIFPLTGVLRQEKISIAYGSELIEPFGGWSTWFDLKGANDATVALVAVGSCF